MTTTRRDLIRKVLKTSAGLTLALAPLGSLTGTKPLLAAPASRTRWAFLVDVQKCVGCGLCVKACKQENEIEYDAHVSPTWVERYVLTRDGTVFADSPNSARDGFNTTRIELGGEGYKDIPADSIEKAFFVPKLCNHCDNPPCVQVCPVGATYQTATGVVLVDRTWCIGCGYCIMACPYGARFFDPRTSTAAKCTFCYHRITKGLKTACVQACPFGARRFGNLADPNDPVARVVATQRVGVLKEEYGTNPQAYYLGLSKEVR